MCIKLSTVKLLSGSSPISVFKFHSGKGVVFVCAFLPRFFQSKLFHIQWNLWNRHLEKTVFSTYRYFLKVLENAFYFIYKCYPNKPALSIPEIGIIIRSPVIKCTLHIPAHHSSDWLWLWAVIYSWIVSSVCLHRHFDSLWHLYKL